MGAGAKPALNRIAESNVGIRTGDIVLQVQAGNNRTILDPALHGAGAGRVSRPVPIPLYFRPYWKKIDDPSFKLIAK